MWPTREDLCRIAGRPETGPDAWLIHDEALAYAADLADPDYGHQQSRKSQAIEASLDKVDPSFPKDKIRKYYAELRSKGDQNENGSSSKEAEENMLLMNIQRMQDERALLSPKSQKTFDAKHSEAFWTGQDDKTRANRKNLEIAAAAANEVIPYASHTHSLKTVIQMHIQIHCMCP